MTLVSHICDKKFFVGPHQLKKTIIEDILLKAALHDLHFAVYEQNSWDQLFTGIENFVNVSTQSFSVVLFLFYHQQMDP